MWTPTNDDAGPIPPPVALAWLLLLLGSFLARALGAVHLIPSDWGLVIGTCLGLAVLAIALGLGAYYLALAAGLGCLELVDWIRWQVCDGLDMVRDAIARARAVNTPHESGDVRDDTTPRRAISKWDLRDEE